MTDNQDRFIAKLSSLWEDQQDRELIAKAVQSLNARYEMNRKMTDEPGVEAIVEQMFARLANTYGRISDIQNKRILDIACGSNTSKAPASLYFRTLGGRSFENTSQGYTALFEPWFCRIVLELGANSVGVDMGDLENEHFEHYRVDLGEQGALDFLPDHSCDAVQDSRLFGSPEFTAQFPNHANKIKVAQEVVRQEARLLKPDGIVIHSDAAELVR